MSTVTISASDVAKLRKSTGAGMMDCKKALTEAGGDFDEAVLILRKKGQKVAAKRADREASEGHVVAKSLGNFGILLTLNCETDFVAKNADFVALAEKFLELAITNKVENAEALNAVEFEAGVTVAEKIVEQTGVIGEKLEISCLETISAESVVAYNHPGNNVAALVGFNQADADEAILRDVAMQVAAMSPLALNEDGVDAETKEREFNLGKEQAIKEGKPENIVDKVAEGKVKKFLKENTLVNQPSIKENKLTVAQYLDKASKGLEATAFRRYSLS